jgi:hypothetical protein
VHSLHSRPVDFTVVSASEKHDVGIVDNVHRHPSAGEIEVILSQYVSANVVSFLGNEGVRIVPVPTAMTYAPASIAAGFFVLEERTVYLRIISSLTVVHELGHALDCVLGGGPYLSSRDPTIHRAFAGATQFVTPYAATSLSEFFAENWRAFLGANDPYCLWPTVTRARLAACAPTVLALFHGILLDIRQSPRQDLLLGTRP